MNRTVRAALLAAFIGFGFVAGILLFLQVPVVASLVTGGVVGLLSGLLIWGAGRRADSFHPTDEITPVEPGFPGPPEHHDGDERADEDADDA